MSILSLRLNHFRCFDRANFTFHPQFNFILGNNGSGKTALLEAVSLLCSGRSFRSRETSPLIQYSQQELQLSASLSDGQTIDVSKNTTRGMNIKINDQHCMRLSELARILPAQVIYQDLFEIMDAGPLVRRQLLDWGLFHVKLDYFLYLQHYKQALKQRNQLLKNKARIHQFKEWNRTLSDLGEKIHELRLNYLHELNPLFKKYLKRLEAAACDIQYVKGWDKKHQGLSLEECLDLNYESDLFKQYTQQGAHHADLVFETEIGKAKQYLSRGQQKIILIALRIAQAELLNKDCIFIWDDVFSELDVQRMERLWEVISSSSGQYFLTSHQEDLDQKLRIPSKQWIGLSDKFE